MSFSRARSTGFTVIELLVALAILCLIVGGLYAGLSATGRALTAQRGAQQQTSALENLVDRLYSSANSSASIYLPSSCGGTGAADDVGCSTVRFYGVDASGDSHFWGFTQSAGTVTEYVDLPSVDAPDSSGKALLVVPNVSTFAADPTPASESASKLGLGTVASIEPNLLGTDVDPQQRVVGGNRTMTVQIVSGVQRRVAVLLSHDSVYQEDVITHTVETPQVANAITCADVSCAYTFAAVSGTHIAAFTDTNFGQYTGFLGSTPAWTTTACSDAYGVTVASIGAIVVTGDIAGVTVTPKFYGTCTFTITNAAGLSATETITVGGSPGDSLTISPATVTLETSNYGLTQAATVAIAETGIYVSGHYATLLSGASSGGATTTCNPAYVTWSISGSTLSLVSSGINDSGATSCTIAVYDAGDYNPGNPYTNELIGTLTVDLMDAPPTPSPTPTLLPAVPVPSPPLGAEPTSPGSATATPLGPCARQYGPPSFQEPGPDHAPPLAEMYAAVSAAGANARIPNGNTMYGFWDDFQPSDLSLVKGAILLAENTDCSVTMIMGTSSSSAGRGELFEMAAVFNVPNNDDMFSYTAAPVIGCGGATGSCTPASGTIYQPVSLSAVGGESTSWNVQSNDEEIIGGTYDSPSGCANDKNGGSDGDYDSGARYYPGELAAPTYSLDTIGISYEGNSDYSLARVVMQPYRSVQYIPRPGLAHILRSNGHAVCYFNEGSGWYGTGPTGDVIGTNSEVSGSGAPASQTTGLVLSGYAP